MGEYTASYGHVDEDGFRDVRILLDGETVSAWTVRADMARQWAEQEIDILQRFADDEGECPHGLSAALCMGPHHYE